MLGIESVCCFGLWQTWIIIYLWKKVFWLLFLEVCVTEPNLSSCLQVATGQVASTGMVALSYVQKLSDKVGRMPLDRLLTYLSLIVIPVFPPPRFL